MRVRSVAVVASTAVALISAGVVVAPAALAVDEDPVIVSVDARPEPVGLWKTSSSQVTVDVVITDDVAVSDVKVEIVKAPRLGDDDVPPDRASATATLVNGTAQNGTWRATMFLTKNDIPGVWSTRVTVHDSAGNGAFAAHAYDEGYSVPPVDDFSVLRNTMIRGFNVAKPATRGSYIRMYGRLVRLDPAAGYVGYGGATMGVWFRPAGRPTWQKKGSVTTSATGYFTNSHTFRAWQDGAWRVVFAGTTTYLAETSQADYVDVR
jgi:hypothetical protein